MRRLRIKYWSLVFVSTLLVPIASAQHANICQMTTDVRELDPRGTRERLGSVRLNCGPILSTDISLFLSANFEVTDDRPALRRNGVVVGSPTKGSSNRWEWLGLDIRSLEGETAVTLRISGVRIDATQFEQLFSSEVLETEVVVFLGAQGLIATNNVLSVGRVEAPCDYSLSGPTTSLSPRESAGSATVAVQDWCSWNAATSSSWLSLTGGESGVGEGVVSFEAEANPSSEPRTATIQIGDQQLEITQEGAIPPADLTISTFTAPTELKFGEAAAASMTILNAGEGAVDAFRAGVYLSEDEAVTTNDRFARMICESDGLAPGESYACEGSILAPETLTPGSYFAGAVVDDVRRVEESDETNNVMLNSNGPVQVLAAITGPSAPAAVLNAGSFQPGLAPGLFVSLFGEEWADSLQAADEYPLPTELGDVSVAMGDARLALGFVSEGQINGVASYDLAVGEIVPVKVRKGEAESDPLEVFVQAAMPGLLTVAQDGSGQGAILDENYRLADTDSPVPPGGLLQVFCVGLGAVTPSVAAGQAADPEVGLSRTVARIEMTVGGVPGEVLFAGLAPGFSGLYQVNALLGPDTPSGPTVPVQIVVRFDDGSVFVSNEATTAVGAL